MPCGGPMPPPRSTRRSATSPRARAEVGCDARRADRAQHGEVIVGDRASGQALVVGDAVNVAARLERAAPSGGILLGPTTYTLVRDHVSTEATEPLELKGKSAPLVAHRLMEVGPPAVAGDVRPDPPFVGRASELELLSATFHDVVARSASGLLTVLGSAGVGKSRLAREFVVDRRRPSRSCARLPYGRHHLLAGRPAVASPGLRRSTGVAGRAARRHPCGRAGRRVIAERIASLMGSGGLRPRASGGSGRSQRSRTSAANARWSPSRRPSVASPPTSTSSVPGGVTSGSAMFLLRPAPDLLSPAGLGGGATADGSSRPAAG
jgi:hypothetical protein